MGEPDELEGTPRAVFAPAPLGAVARAMRTVDGALVDLWVRGDEAPRVERRALPETDPAAIERWLGLLGRRRGQLAHDLSGPATGVLAAVETILEYEPIEASTRGLLRDAREGMVRMTRLLEARDRLNPTPNVVEGALDALTRRWLDGALRALGRRDEQLAIQITAPDRRVRVDAARARAALVTLLDNAWRHRRGSDVQIEVQAEVAAGWLHLTVDDEGRGMDEAALAAAGDLGFSSRTSGVGLSLFALRFALRDDGWVRLERRTVGARVEVFLPANTLPDR